MSQSEPYKVGWNARLTQPDARICKNHYKAPNDRREWTAGHTAACQAIFNELIKSIDEKRKPRPLAQYDISITPELVTRLSMTQQLLTQFPNTAFRNGYMSFWNGRRADENPYTAGSALHDQWAEGNSTASEEHVKLYGEST